MERGGEAEEAEGGRVGEEEAEAEAEAEAEGEAEAEAAQPKPDRSLVGRAPRLLSAAALARASEETRARREGLGLGVST